LGANLWTERRSAGSAADHAGRSGDEELHRLRDARVRRLLDVPRREELHGEVANLAPIFIAPEPFLQPISELVAEGCLDVSPLEAARGADHALGEGVDAPSQLGQGAIDQLAFHLPSLGLLLSVLPLKSGSFDQALDERLYGVHGRRRAEVAKRAFHIGAQAESDLGWRVGRKRSLSLSHDLSEPGKTCLGVWVGGPRIRRRPGSSWMNAVRFRPELEEGGPAESSLTARRSGALDLAAPFEIPQRGGTHAEETRGRADQVDAVGINRHVVRHASARLALLAKRHRGSRRTSQSIALAPRPR
jgi:hypothetical protein